MAASDVLNPEQWLNILSFTKFWGLLVSGGSYWPLINFVRNIDTMITNLCMFL